MPPTIYFFPYPSCGSSQNNRNRGPVTTAGIISLWVSKGDGRCRDRLNWYQNFFPRFSLSAPGILFHPVPHWLLLFHQRRIICLLFLIVKIFLLLHILRGSKAGGRSSDRSTSS